MNIEAFSRYSRPTQITAWECRLELVKAPEYILAVGNQLLSIIKGMVCFKGVGDDGFCWVLGFFFCLRDITYECVFILHCLCFVVRVAFRR